ncbi:MAG TPA: reverse transcriptase domain-containing protein [Vicinamibacterales bacterium]|nr:reverse transcriptase domain-containing protein [Vicinamibacterales bacterium]
MASIGIPAVLDRVSQQALLNRLEPIFEPLFDDSSFGYRRGRSAKDALRKLWREIEAGAEWIVDADLKDYFGSIEPRQAHDLGGPTCGGWSCADAD